MGFRFRRSVKIMPGVRVNFGKRGVSMSAGVRGATVTVGRRGVYGNVGLPGTGMSYRQRLDRPVGQAGGGAGRSTAAAGPGRLGLIMTLSENGTVTFQDEAGQHLPARLVKLAREQNAVEVQRWLEEQCERWNRGIDVLIRSFAATPHPLRIPVHEAAEYPVPYPERPMLLRPGLLHRLWCAVWPPARERLEAENARRIAARETAVAEWTKSKEDHEAGEIERRRAFDAAMGGDPDAMQAYFEQRIQQVEFPWDSGVTFDILDDTLWIDLDLPEIEDLPTEQATVAARGVKVNIKRRSVTQIRKEYMALVHALAFRVAGEGFASLPTVTEVVVSAFSQRSDKSSGHISDEYLISARIPRTEWQQLNWDSIGTADPVEVFSRFDLIRNMTATGIFRPITPHEPADV